MITSKKQLKEYLELELSYYKVSPIVYFLQLSEPAILRRHQILLRKSEYYSNTKKRFLTLIYRILLSKHQSKYSIHIPQNTCGKGLRIMHLGPILINNDARIGKNCALHINTAIVAGGTNGCAPVIGDNVVIGVGAVVLGKAKVANGIAIGANSVVNKEFLEEDIAIAGVPAKKISNNGRKTWGKEKRS